jgi:Flp pilus assembly protein TadG
MKFFRSQRGQSLVEGALTISILMMLVLGLIDFAFVFSAYIGVVNAANAGAVYASTSPISANNLNGITAAVMSETNNWRCVGQPPVSRSFAPDGYGYTKVTVTVACQVAGLVAIPNSFNQITVSASAVRRVRQ